MSEKWLFDYGDLVQYNHPLLGKGKGTVVGTSDFGTHYIIYPKQQLKNDNYPFLCFLCTPNQLIATPF